jgi:hypothetical protein
VTVLRRLSRRLTDSTRLAWKRTLSYRKRQWILEDYPIVVRRQTFDNVPDDAAHESRYWARVLGWCIDETAPTTAEALAKLRDRYEMRRQLRVDKGEPIPRPGTRVPIQFASRERIDAHEVLAEDFIRRVLQLDRALITDESSLWDFTTDTSIREFQDRISLIYSAAVHDIESGNIAEILDRIAAYRRGESASAQNAEMV